MRTKSMNLPKLVEQFGSEDRCREYLVSLRWPGGVVCLHCGSEKVSRIETRHVFHCEECRYQFSVRVGTIFHDSKLPLWKWFLAVYVMCESKKGVSANQLKRMLSVSYKTAWYLCHRIRAAMKDEAPEQLRGIVEVDETLVGGKDPGSIKRGVGPHDNKELVIGAVQRGGQVRLALIASRGKRELHGFIKRHVRDDAKEIHTDEWPAYQGIGDHNTEHKVVNHGKAWVHAGVHTNTCEGVWSLFKRSVVGSYHKLSVKHLPAYLDEMAFRYNNRGNAYMFRDTLLKLIEADRVEYKQLTA